VDAVLQQPDFASFFVHSEDIRKGWLNRATPDCQCVSLVGGSDGGRFSVLELFAPRRIVVPDLRPSSPSFMPRWSRVSRNVRHPSPHSRQRVRRLTIEQEAAIRALAGTKSLRTLAADFGVSHETIRAVTRQMPSS